MFAANKISATAVTAIHKIILLALLPENMLKNYENHRVFNCVVILILG